MLILTREFDIDRTDVKSWHSGYRCLLPLELQKMNRSKLIAVITGAISLLLAIAYLVIVQIIDFRGEMLPAPQSQLELSPVAIIYTINSYF